MSRARFWEYRSAFSRPDLLLQGHTHFSPAEVSYFLEKGAMTSAENEASYSQSNTSLTKKRAGKGLPHELSACPPRCSRRLELVKIDRRRGFCSSPWNFELIK
jgi:hypothetical protein